MDRSIPVNDKISADQHIKAAEFRKDIRVTRPHRHKQYFEIVYLSQGRGHHWIDGVCYEVKPPVLFFINREQVHYWELDHEPEGYVVILKNSFLQQSRDESLKQLLHQLWHANCLYLKKDTVPEVLFPLLCAQAGERHAYQPYAMDGLLKALVAHLLQAGRGHFKHSGLQTQLYARYIDLLLAHPAAQNPVNHFAAQLNTSSQNLNAACRKAVNKSASDILDDFIINEAKRLLLYTDEHVGEIAYRLNFKDPSYFTKYFKKHLFTTPEEYRKAGFQNYHL
ncbi:helix-turn-helix domain-containing protein [Chitinophaga vietnamensis]|uniref:helix-turn-helix domain-containing protein n=1 Tax=Chitinophaga vietnamensis TaxID=2593957 RepID=UPI001177EC07|nr:AraC family transcriptional regulator [Chitinophaga vietnamensis]